MLLLLTTQACCTHRPQHCPLCGWYSKPCGESQMCRLSPGTRCVGRRAPGAAGTHHGAVGVANLGLTADDDCVRVGTVGCLTPAGFAQTGGDHGARLGRVRVARAGELRAVPGPPAFQNVPPPSLAPAGQTGSSGDPRLCLLVGRGVAGSPKPVSLWPGCPGRSHALDSPARGH